MSGRAVGQFGVVPGAPQPSLQQRQQEMQQQYLSPIERMDAEEHLQSQQRLQQRQQETQQNIPEVGQFGQFGQGSVLSVNPETGGLRLTGGSRPRPPHPGSSVLQSGIPTTRDSEGNVIAAYPDQQRSLEGRSNRRRGLTHNGDPVPKSRETMRQERIAERVENLNAGRKAYIQNRAEKRGLPGPFKPLGVVPGGSGAAPSEHERTRNQLLDSELVTQQPVETIEDVSVMVQGQAQMLFDQMLRGDRTEEKILAKASEMESELPAGVSIVAIVQGLLQQWQEQTELERQDMELKRGIEKRFGGTQTGVPDHTPEGLVPFFRVSVIGLGG